MKKFVNDFFTAAWITSQTVGGLTYAMMMIIMSRIFGEIIISVLRSL